MSLPPLKAFVTVKDAEGKSYLIELNEEVKTMNNVKATIYIGAILDQHGSPVTVKIAREGNSAFFGRFVRISGNIVTTPAEIAGQLNHLFAEE